MEKTFERMGVSRPNPSLAPFLSLRIFPLCSASEEAMRLLLDLIFCYSCCLYFLVAVSSIADAGDDGLNACFSSTCANVKNVTFPFGATPSCAASPSFLLSNCTTKQAYWNNFSKAIIYGAVPPLGPPAVLGISSNGYSIGQVNLTWNRNLIENVQLPYNICTPAPSSNISDYLPYAINLTVFADPAFVVSPNNIYLLFDCTNLTSLQSHDLHRLLEKNSSYCRSFQKQCKLPGNPNCLQFAPDNELMLQSVMNRLSCKRFQFFLTLNFSDYVVKEWRAGIVQLTWTNSKCTNCEKSNGKCNYDKHKNFECSNAAECHGLCSTRSKIATGVATSGVVIAVLAVLAVCSLQWRRHVSTKSVPKSSSNKFSTQRALCLSAKFGPVSVQEFSYEELQEATESFADENLIGNGGFGAVYVGLLRDGVKVAIKRLYHDNFTRMEQFYNEMKILSSLQHPNLVKLYGFCCQDDRDLLLVFEYASKGTVSDQLHDPNKPGMPWEVRLNIAWETAEALSYLHNSAIFHRDVKTTNILLDDKFHAKLADFGLSRLVPLEVTHVSTAPQGTPGYVDPEYHQCYQLTYKSDVYSFGVVLMELVSAKLAVDMSRNRKEINLSGLALMKIACGAWEELVDPRLEMDKNPDVERMVKGVVELAFECLHAEKDDRPNMSLVAETLANLRRLSVSGYEEEVISAQNSKVDIHFLSADETIKSESAFNSASSLNSLRSSAWRSCNTSSGF